MSILRRPISQLLSLKIKDKLSKPKTSMFKYSNPRFSIPHNPYLRSMFEPSKPRKPPALSDGHLNRGRISSWWRRWWSVASGHRSRLLQGDGTVRRRGGVAVVGRKLHSECKRTPYMQLAGKRVAGGDGGAEKRDRAKGRAVR